MSNPRVDLEYSTFRFFLERKFSDAFVAAIYRCLFLRLQIHNTLVLNHISFDLSVLTISASISKDAKFSSTGEPFIDYLTGFSPILWNPGHYDQQCNYEIANELRMTLKMVKDECSLQSTRVPIIDKTLAKDIRREERARQIYFIF